MKDMPEEKKSSEERTVRKVGFFEKLMGIVVLLLLFSTFTMLVLASNNIIPVGLPLISFGAIFVIVSLGDRSARKMRREKRGSSMAAVIIGVAVIAIGVALLGGSVEVSVYAFLGIFGMAGLGIILYLVYSYVYSKKNCTRRLWATCVEVPDENGRKEKMLKITGEEVMVSGDGILGYGLFVTGQAYEIMVDPNNYEEGYVVGYDFWRENRMILVVMIALIAVSLGGIYAAYVMWGGQ